MLLLVDLAVRGVKYRPLDFVACFPAQFKRYNKHIIKLVLSVCTVLRLQHLVFSTLISGPRASHAGHK